ncbi:LbtU family siderophore porin [Sulfurovum sp.]|jgi:hypothetical protein|uniref:LbtU family siderophore porin n=1 Tax=Sulfurovum sp. TaxID=1969726 RepID=UPI002A35CAC0|nr:LbtU family siderophore porin [Sulfurovum sp.]MDY0403470.1 LbtU family siderophore porin [Sulfurovum sp.]
MKFRIGIAAFLAAQSILMAAEPQTLDILASKEKSKSERFETSLLMQSRLTYDKTEGEPSQTDVGIRRIELGLTANVNEWISGNFLYIFEDIGKEGEINLLEEAYIRIGNSEETPLYFQIGKMLLPFGKFDYFTAREPYTIDFAETIKNAVLIGYDQNGVNLNAYVFMDENDQGKDEPDYFGASLAYERSLREVALSAQLSYMSDITKAGGFGDALSGVEDPVDKTAAYGIALTAEAGQLGLITEYIAATDEILGVNTQAAILNLEAAYTFPFATAALSYIKTREAEFAALREMRDVSHSQKRSSNIRHLRLSMRLLKGMTGWNRTLSYCR